MTTQTIDFDFHVIRYIASQTKSKSPDDIVAFYVRNFIFKNVGYLDTLIEKYKLPKNDFLKIDAKIQKLAEKGETCGKKSN